MSRPADSCSKFMELCVESAQAAELSAPENCWDVASDPVLSIN